MRGILLLTIRNRDPFFIVPESALRKRILSPSKQLQTPTLESHQGAPQRRRIQPRLMDTRKTNLAPPSMGML